MTDQVNTRGLALEFLLEVEKGSNNKKLEDIGTITVKQYQEVLKNILY